MAYPVAGYSNLATARPQGGPQELARGRVDVGDVSAKLLAALDAIGASMHRTIVIFSGYRTSAYSSSVGGFANDPHTQARAVDATIGGKPIGTVVSAQTFARYGLQTGNVPGFYKGQPDPSHVQLPSGSDASPTPGSGSNTGNASQAAVLTTIVQAAYRYGVDPLAALAVAAHEGLSGGVGDSGTSFGPWQLHIGGALPADIAARGPDYAKSWAWSPAGIDYALRKQGEVAGGKTGRAAIVAIVTGFERPLRPGPEIAGANSTYQALRSSVGQPPNPSLASFGGTLEDWAGKALKTGALELAAPGLGLYKLLPDAAHVGGGLNPLNWPGELAGVVEGEFVKYALRGGEILFGALLVMGGLVLLARSVGAPMPGPAGVAGAISKAGAPAAEAAAAIA